MKLSDCRYLGYVSQSGNDGQFTIRFDTAEDSAKDLKKGSVMIKMQTSDLELVPFFFDRILKEKNGEIQLQLDHQVHFNDEALQLKGKRVYLPSNKPNSNQSDWSLTDLIGFEVIDHAKGFIGKLADYYDSAAHPVLSVTAENGNEILIPYVEEVIVLIDQKKQLIKIQAPEGLIEMYLS